MTHYGLVVVPTAPAGNLCAEVLRELGMEPVAADDGEAALAEIAVRGAPAVVLTELSLPRVDGFAFLEQLRRELTADEVPAVVVSAFAHLRQTASQLQDKLGVAWIVPAESVELFLRQAVRESLGGTVRREPEAPSAEHHRSRERHQRIEALELVNDGPPDGVLQSIVADTAELFGVPVALVSLVLQDRQWFKAHVGLGGDLLEQRGTPVDQSFCRHAVDAQATLVVPDASANPFFRNTPLVRAGLVGSYAGAPLIAAGGEVLGTLCIIDDKPFRIDANQVRALEVLARRVVGEIQLTISERRLTRQKQSIQSALHYLSGPSGGLDDAVVLFGPDLRVQFANSAAEKILRHSTEELSGLDRDDLMRRIAERVEDPAAFTAQLRAPAAGAFSIRGEFTLSEKPPRRIRWIEEPLATEAGTTQACFLRDVTAVSGRIEAAPLPRDRATQTVLGEISRARGQGVPISFALFDARARDVESEPTPDRSRIHRQATDILRECADPAYSVTRWGPHEYLVAMPNATIHAAMTFVTRVQRAARTAHDPVRMFAGVAELESDLHAALACAATQIRRQQNMATSNAIPAARPSA